MPGLLKKMLCCGLKNSSSHNKVTEGHVRVYVGKETPCKFEVEANYLNHPLFENLLQLSVEEFGYSYKGALRIACEIDLFQYLLDLLESRNPSVHYMELQDLISKFYGGNGTSTTDHQHHLSKGHHDHAHAHAHAHAHPHMIY